MGQAVRIGALKTEGKSRRALANPVRRLGLLAIVGVALISFSALGGPEDIGTETHAGEMAINGVGTGSWSTGNITQYREGDQIRFRFEVDTTSEVAKSGKLNIAFSLEDAVCHFFDGSLELGAVETLEGPAVWTVTKIGTAIVSGNEWIQTIQIDKAAGTSPTGLFIGRVNYTLKLENDIGVCGGSSQHTRLENHPTDPGDVVSDGLKNVPVPGNQIIVFPDITVTKYVDRDSDGIFETTASAGEFSFALDGATTLLTDSSGTVVFEQVQPDGDHTITEQQIDFSNGTYDFDHGDGTNTTFVGSTATTTVYAGTSLAVQNAQANFYNTASNPALSIDKSAGSYVDSNASGTPDAGESITYSYVVTNVGNITLTGIVVSDDRLGTITMSATTLAPSQQATGQKTHTLTQAEIDNGSVTNIATADSNETLPLTDTVSIALAQEPSITLIKTGTLDMSTVAPTDRADVGDTVTYSFTVTNTGNVTLTNVTVTDPQITVLGAPIASLAPGASDSSTFTGTYTLTQTDVDAGTFVNTATATGTPPSGPNVTGDDDDTQTLTADPAITLVKTGTLDMSTVAPADRADVGDTVTYSFTVTNTGSVTLTNVSVSDPLITVLGAPIASLVPGVSDSSTFTGTYTLTQSDLDAGTFVNTATATGTPPTGPNVTGDDDDTQTLTADPAITLIKTGDAGPVSVGETIAYQIAVTNIGNVTLHNVTVTDTLLGMSQNLGTLAPGDSQIISGTYGPVSEGDLPGPLVNTATADSDETPPVEDDHSVEVLPIGIDLHLTKIVDNVSPEIGELVTFDILIANGLNTVEATNVEVTDTLPAGYAFVGFAVNQGTYTYAGVNSVWVVGNLPAGSSAALQVFATVLEDGPYEAPSEVTAADQEDIDSVPANASLVSEDDDDRAVVWIDTPIADLLVIKTVDNANPNEEETIVFTISVYNGGPYTSTGIVLQDALPSGLTYISDTSGGAYNPATNAWDVGTLIVGDAASFTLSALVDLGTAGTTLTNTALIIQNEIEDPSPANNRDSADVTIRDKAVCEGKIIISEIAWAGTAANPEDEWIELRNIGGEPVDLTGWVLRWRKKQPITPEDFEWKIVQLFGELQASSTPICELTNREPAPAVDFIKREVDDLSWFVEANPVDFDESYMLLERGSDLTVSDIDADIIYDDIEPYSMELSDDGDTIELLDINGEIVDTANAFPSYDGNWPAGNLLTRGTMERIDPLGLDERDNWHTNLGIITRGLDANGQPLVASSDVVNSQTLEEMELFANLNPTIILPGTRLEVGLALLRDSRLETGWPWIRVTRPGVTSAPDTAGGTIEPVYSFASRYANGTYWLGIDTAGLVPGDYLIWAIYGEGQTVLVPITILD